MLAYAHPSTPARVPPARPRAVPPPSAVPAAATGHSFGSVPVFASSAVRIGPAGDAWERQADDAAAAVMRTADGTVDAAQPRITPVSATHGTAVQRLASGAGHAPPRLDGWLAQTGPRGAALPSSVRAFMEPRFGTDFGGVRVHTGGEAARMSQALGAHAFTHGRDIYYGPGRAPAADALTAHELAHVVQQTGPGSGGGGIVQMMRACPPTLRGDQDTPAGWQSYHGNASVFHCGFRGILENRVPTPEDPQNECFYDHSGTLVTPGHPFAGCGGTPNQYDSADSPVSHTLRDSGGILYAGLPAFITSRVYDVSSAVSAAVQVVETTHQVMIGVGGGLADMVALGVLTGVATAQPTNWVFRGLPGRAVRDLNMMGMILTSEGMAGTLDVMLRNLTRRLGSFDIASLLDDLAADINQAQEARGPAAPQVLPAQLAELSMVQMVEFLRTQALLSYSRAPEDVAAERLARMRAGQAPAE